MKKIYFIIMMAAAMVACTNVEMEQPVDANASQVYTMTVKATKDGAAATKGLTLDDSGENIMLNATWTDGEKVLVYQGENKIGELTATASETDATTLSGTLSAPDPTQTLTFYYHTNSNPSYSGQDGTLTTIASSFDFCAPATVAAGKFTVNGGTVSVPEGVSFGANQQAIVKFTLLDRSNVTTLLSPSTLSVAVDLTESAKSGLTSLQLAALSSYFPRTFIFTPAPSTYTANGEGIIFLAVPDEASKYLPIVNSLLELSLTKDDFIFALTATVGSDTFTYTKEGFPFVNGQYYEITVKMKNDKIGKVLGKDGNIYDNVSAATSAGTTAVAMIAYVGPNTGESKYTNGLAIALNDIKEGWGVKSYQYKTDNTATNHDYRTKTTPFKPEGGLQYYSHNFDTYPAFGAAFNYDVERNYWHSNWFLGTGYQWQQMIASMGSNMDLRNAFSAIGGENMATAGYWVSTEYDDQRAWFLTASTTSDFYFTYKGIRDDGINKSLCYVRPILAF